MSGIYGLGAKLVISSLTSVYSTDTETWSYSSTSATLVEITNIGEISMSADDIDVSSHASRIKSYVKGLVEMGEVPFTGNYKTTDGPVIQKYLTNLGSTETQQIIVPGKFKMTFPGYVKAFGFSIPHDNKVTMSGAIKVAGAPTLSASTS